MKRIKQSIAMKKLYIEGKMKPIKRFGKDNPVWKGE